MARIGFEDVILPIEDVEKSLSVVDEKGDTFGGTYLIGYEDEDGEECEEDGTYLNQ